MTTIEPGHAEELYDALGGRHGELADGDATAGRWALLGSQLESRFRWHDSYWLVVQDPDGIPWGLYYTIGTGGEADRLPWLDTAEPLPLTRLYPHTVTRVKYRKSVGCPT